MHLTPVQGPQGFEKTQDWPTKGVIVKSVDCKRPHLWGKCVTWCGLQALILISSLHLPLAAGHIR